MPELNKTIGKIFTGKVVSDKMTNTLVVSLDYKFRHPVIKNCQTPPKDLR